jgi:hypothetical protein
MKEFDQACVKKKVAREKIRSQGFLRETKRERDNDFVGVRSIKVDFN